MVLLNGSTAIGVGICFNTRLEVLACTLDLFKILLRKPYVFPR